MEPQEQKQRRGARRNQKLKILYLAKILLENTDANYDITLQEIIDKLPANNVTAERKSLYDDIAQLDDFGIKIRKIEHLASKHDAAMLQRQVYVAGRVKAMNRDIMENVDAIHNAIAQNSKNWIMALGDGAKIIGPEKLVEEVRGEINRLMAQCSK